MKPLFAVAVAFVSLIFVLGQGGAGDKDKKPKYTIKEIMEKAHDEGALLEKITEGMANAKEKKQLVVLYVELQANTPPKGDKAKWAKVTKSMVVAAKAVADSKDEKDKAPVLALAKIVSCKSCHDEFKPAK